MGLRRPAWAVACAGIVLAVAAPASATSPAAAGRARSCGAISSRYSVKVLNGPVSCGKARRAARGYLHHRQARGWFCRRALDQAPLVAICDYHTTLSSPRKGRDASQAGIFRRR